MLEPFTLTFFMVALPSHRVERPQVIQLWTQLTLRRLTHLYYQVNLQPHQWFQVMLLPVCHRYYWFQVTLPLRLHQHNRVEILLIFHQDFLVNLHLLFPPYNQVEHPRKCPQPFPQFLLFLPSRHLSSQAALPQTSALQFQHSPYYHL